jgi:hypothetical protein
MNNNSSRKILLSNYLTARRTPTVLSAGECKIFGIPYPLESGWMHQFRELEITPAKISHVRKYVESKTSASAEKTRAALMTLDQSLLESEEPARSQPSLDFESACLDAGPTDGSGRSTQRDQSPPWEVHSQRNPTVDYLRHLLVRCECGEVTDVTVIEYLSDGTQTVRDANRGRR